MCSLPIAPTGPEYDLEFASNAIPILVRFHRVCLAMWELLRRGAAPIAQDPLSRAPNEAGR